MKQSYISGILEMYGSFLNKALAFLMRFYKLTSYSLREIRFISCLKTSKILKVKRGYH